MPKVLRPYQEDSLRILRQDTSGLDASEMGAGKTITAVERIRDLDRRPSRDLIVCPLNTQQQWYDTCAEQFPALVRRDMLHIVGTPNTDPDSWKRILSHEKGVWIIGWEAMRGRVPQETRRANTKKRTKNPGLTMSAIRQAMKDGDVPPWDKAGTWDLVIADECVPHNSKISTPKGPQNISDLKPGDLVLGVDHSSGEAVWTEVKGVSRSPIRKTLRVGNLDLTHNHPIWVTKEGGVLYDEWYNRDDCGDRDLRTVRESLRAPLEREEAPVLFEPLRQAGISYRSDLLELRKSFSGDPRRSEVLFQDLCRCSEEEDGLCHLNMQNMQVGVLGTEVPDSNILFQSLCKPGSGSFCPTDVLSASGKENWPKGETPSIGMRAVQQDLRNSPVSETEILRQDLCCKMECCEPDGGSHTSPEESLVIHEVQGVERAFPEDYEPTARAAGCTEKDQTVPYVRVEPVPRSGSAQQGSSNFGVPGVEPSHGREWCGSYRSAADVAQGTRRGVDHGISDQDGSASGIWVPLGVQGGLGTPGSEDGHRSSWQGSRASGWSRNGERQEEAEFSRVHWLDGSVDMERGDPERSLWNIETGTGNYFANGLLVHNCHRIASRTAAQTKVMGIIGKKARHRLALSGTPSGSAPQGLWSVLNWLWPDQYTAFWDWAYTWLHIEEKRTGGGNTILAPGGEKVPGALWKTIPCVVRHRTKDILPDLPEVIERTVSVPMAPQQEKIYQEFEEQAMAWLDDQPVATPLSLTQRIRLRQAALGTLTARVKNDELDISFSQRAPQPKIEAIREIISDLPEGESVLVFTHSAKWALLAAEKLNKDFPARAWTGALSQKQRQELKTSFGKNIQVIIAQIASIAEGTDGFQHVCRCEIWASVVDGDVVLNSQAERRLHRPGQSSPVQRWRLTTPQTIDDEVHMRLLLKRHGMHGMYRDNRAA